MKERTKKYKNQIEKKRQISIYLTEDEICYMTAYIIKNAFQQEPLTCDIF